MGDSPRQAALYAVAHGVATAAFIILGWWPVAVFASFWCGGNAALAARYSNERARHIDG